MLTRLLLVATCAAVLCPTRADAQIYAWRDATGNLVLSDRKQDTGAKTYAVPDAPQIRSTRPLASRTIREQFEPLVQEYAKQQGVRADLVRAVIQVESGFNPRARSPKGAMGLMQLMPATARELGVRNAYDPEENVRGGTEYLRQLLDKYEGNEELALAAYNAGSGAVDRYGRRVPPYPETKDYVRKVGSAADGTMTGPRRGDPKNIIYKIVDIVDGAPVVRYTSERPTAGGFEIVGGR
jgi:soluble lytic murein transglycosylase-like protein